MLRSSYGVLADVRMMLDKIQGRVSKLVCFCAKRPCQKPPENLCWERNRGSVTRRELFGQSIQGMGAGPRSRYQHTGFGGQNSGRGPTRTPGVFPGKDTSANHGKHRENVCGFSGHLGKCMWHAPNCMWDRGWSQKANLFLFLDLVLTCLHVVTKYRQPNRHARKQAVRVHFARPQ